MNQGEMLRKLDELKTPNNTALALMLIGDKETDEQHLVGVHYHNHHLNNNFYISYN